MVDSTHSHPSEDDIFENASKHYVPIRDISADWAEVHHCTAPADRERAEAGAKAAYAAAGLPEPKLFIWVDSPKAGYVAARVFRGQQSWTLTGDLRTDEVHNNALQAFQDEYRDWMKSDDWYELKRHVGTVERHVGHSGLLSWPGDARVLEDVIEDELGLRAWGQTAKQIILFRNGSTNPRGHANAMGNAATYTAVDREMLTPPAFGQFSAANMAYVTALGALVDADTSGLHGIFEIARSAGFWWPFENAVILTERPVTRRVDLDGNLHNSSGQALGYVDGFGGWCWRGIPVPKTLIEGDWRLEDVLAEREPLIRRCAVERLGWDFVQQAQLRQIGESVPDPDDDRHLISLFKVPRRYYERFRGYDDPQDEPRTVKLLLCSSVRTGRPCHDGVTVSARFDNVESAAQWAMRNRLLTPIPVELGDRDGRPRSRAGGRK